MASTSILPAIAELVTLEAAFFCSAVSSPAPKVTPEFAVILVPMAPGQTKVRATLVSFNSERRPSVNMFNAALDAPYKVCPGTGANDPIDETLTMWASGREINSGKKVFTRLSGPKKLTFMTRSTSSMSRSLIFTNG